MRIIFTQPGLARCFACCQSCSVSLRTLWAYGFDSATQRAPEKLRLVKLTLTFFLIPLIERQKSLIYRQTGMFLKINFQILGNVQIIFFLTIV